MMTNRKANLLILGASVALALGIAESILRYLNIGNVESPTWIEQRSSRTIHPYKKNSRLVYRYPDNPRGYFDDNNEVVGKINSMGFRGRETDRARLPGVTRIAFIGDSFTLGIGVTDIDTLPAQTEAALRRRGVHAEALNFGVSGSSTPYQGHLLRRYVIDFNPDIVVMVVFLNDANRVGTTHYLAKAHYMKSARRKSRLLNLVVESIEKQILGRQMIDHYKEGFTANSDGWRKIKLAIERARIISERNHIQLYVAVYPVLFKLDHSYPFTGIHRKIGEFVNSLDLEFIDLLEAFEDATDTEMWVHRVDQHPNEIAHSIAAEYLASRLEETLNMNQQFDDLQPLKE